MVKLHLLIILSANIFLLVSCTGQQPTTPCGPPVPVLYKLNEIWSSCPIAVCAPKTCNDVGFPVACPDLPPDGKCPVKPGYICRENYVRNSANICIPMNQCPSCGGDPNAESTSGGSDSNRLCPNSNQKACDQSCLFNCCQCKLGFLFDESKGKCVFPSQCTCVTCQKKNEVYDLCPAPCPFRTCGINDAAISCVPPLCPGDPNCPPPKCRCRDGYYRNDVGECVLLNQCPICTGLNEMYDPCPAPCPPQSCDVNIALILCAVPPKLGDPECQPGCRCIDDYVRNREGVCIPRYKCPSCPQNEVYDRCIAPCPPRRCDVDERLIKCAPPPTLGDPSCKAGCRCDNGYYRNSQGVCVTRDECPLICKGRFEVYNECIQGDCRPKTCSQLDFPLACPRIDPKFCKKGCLCKDGYVRDSNNVCIPKDQCPLICKGRFEVYNECIQGDCRPKTCSQLDFPLACPRIDPKFCKKGCLCEDGYVRDSNNVCIPQDQCPQACKNNEEYSECINGGCLAKNCSQVGFPIPCVKLDSKSCIKGCLCKEGYLKEDTGECVLAKDCKPRCNKPNEVYASCDYGCPPNTCESLDRAYACPIREGDVCKGRCKCRTGFLRNSIGECITEKQCQKCNGPHEYYSCKGPCDNVCETINEQNQTNCPLVNKKCTEKCYCEKDYARAKNGTCILIKDCKKPQCGIHERYEKCPPWLCEPKKCTELGSPVPCPFIPAGGKCPVEPACVCIDGYVRNSKGQCILKENCPEYCSGINEIFENCTNPSCIPKKCSELGFPLNCTDPPTCNKGCNCKEGYVRNQKGICIPINKCPTCGGDPNAESTNCANNCGRLCSDYFKKDVICTRECQLYGCSCRKGYVYDSNTGKCVLPENCTQVCKSNEVYSTCINGGCTAKYCSQVGSPVPCIKLDPKSCIKGCLCKDGYLREDDTGECVPVENCKPKCNKPNEYYKACDYDCPPNTCESLNRTYACPIREGVVCKGRCKCKKGFLRNRIGECITEEQCRTCMGPHEYYSCGIPCDNVCKTINEQNQTNCPLVNIKCTEKCYCEKDYARAKNDSCIPIKDCNEPQCEINERYEKCPAWLCKPKKCSELSDSVPCPYVRAGSKCPVKPACVCIDGYVRNTSGKCIPKENCPEYCSGINEVYENCSNPKCIPKKCSELGFPLNCTDPCNKGCICKEGNVRNSKDICIPITKCPSCGGDPNAESTNCASNCGRLCSNYFKKNVACTLECRYGCSCRKDYVFDSNTGFCVLPKDCTPVCQTNEVYSDCINGGCTAKNCSQVGLPLPCVKLDPKFCIKGCLCKKGYLRNNTGECVLAENCKPKVCSRKNEVYEDCTNPSCSPKNCSEVGFDLNCTNPPICNKGCICKGSYVRDSNGNCIPIKNCPSCKGDKNAVSGCGVNCLKKCYDLQNPKSPRPCPKICKLNSCDCKEGFYYDQNTGRCVSSDECSPTCNTNEVYDPCINGGCTKRNCSQLSGPTLCIDPIKCKPGCTCKKGYLRSDENICIPVEQCPTEYCSGINEVYENCSNPRCIPKKCSELGFPLNCTDPPTCNKGCICKEGNVRNSKDICIPITTCPSCGGDPNAESTNCGSNCGRLCSNYFKKNVPCTLICRLYGCSCRKEYVFDSNTGFCVLPKDCTPVCKTNEVYSDCINGGCTAKNCSQVGLSIPCVKLDPKFCIKGCLCKKGYLRDGTGECVLAEDCKPKVCSKKNEVYEDCTNPSCSPKNCSEVGFDLNCMNPPKCNKGCICKGSYVRDSNGNCIPIKNCPSCKGDKNAVSGCGVNCLKNCYDLQNPNSPRPCPKICKLNSCDCKEGFYYDQNTGLCVSSDECSPACETNEIYDPCINGGCTKRNCSQLSGPTLCIDPIKCKPGCTCKEGYLRSDENICVPIDQCPTEYCSGINEVYENCSNPRCIPKKCSELGFPLNCTDPPTCNKGCICKEGNVRNSKDICIPITTCPSCGGDPNAESTNCGSNCGRLCSNYFKKNVPCTLICRLYGCSCRKEYVYDSNTGFCVLPKDCTPVCKTNEVYSDCINGGCTAKNCSQVGLSIPCVKLDPKFCIKGCLCKKGYLRDDTGECVLAEDCKPKVCSRKNEVYEDCTNPSCSPKNCSEVGFDLNCTNPPICNKGCICKVNYVRDSNGNCIPIKNCPSCKGDKNAVSGCGVNCLKKCYDLQNPDSSRLCPKICKLNSCDCKEGFYYDQNTGLCVSSEECSPACDSNEIYDPCINGGCTKRNCSQLSGPTLCIDPIKCKPGCTCKEGYLRSDDNICVPVDQCPTEYCSGINEVYENCSNPRCIPKKCSELGFPLNCTDPPTCNKGCICKEGNVRNSKDICIPITKCPSCGGDPNAESTNCASNCGRLCSNYLKKNVACTLECRLYGCSCRKDYVFDSNTGVCVLPKDCTPVCKTNEVYSDCINGGCTAKNCSQVGLSIACVKLDPKFCIKGCLCKEGYLRDDTGECVLAEDCKPKVCSRKNEVYEDCTNPSCSPKKCSEVGFDLNCTNPPVCNKGCVCEENYVRDSNGNCISIKECPSCKGDKNAVSGCGVNCLKKCYDLQNPDSPRLCPEICKLNSCDCKEGFYYDENTGLCVSSDECTPACDTDEIYDPCINSVCTKRNCSQLSDPTLCIDPIECEPGCSCKDGYLRSDENICIPVEQCPTSCGGDPNAESTVCASNCGRLCSNYFKKNVACTLECQLFGCSCRKEYVYDSNTGLCVLPKDCTPVCQKNEVYSDCINGGCTAKNCSQVGRSIPCVKLDPKFCIKGCICEEGYLKNDTGECVRAEDCTPKVCSRKNEVYEDCTNPSCSPKNCSEVGFDLNCTNPPICNKGCICKENYVRDSNFNCIPIKKCPSCNGDKNAVSGCGVNCLKTCYDLQNPDSPRPCPKICKLNSCDCKEGFYYDENTGLCVCSDECTPACDINEIYDPCINDGSTKRNCSQLSGPTLCIDPIECKPGCTCKEGYLRSDENICIPVEQCPTPTCSENEVYDTCVNGGCKYRNCSDLNGPILCIDPIECEGGCSCKEDYVRLDDTGVCVPQEKCPKICDKPNEEYVKCPPICPPQTCESINKTYFCPLIKVRINESDCVGECRCIEGYYRNLVNECISEKNCLQCTGAHEYYSCGSACDNVCSDLDTQSKDDCPIKNIICTSKCYCEDNYARNVNNECVPIDECPGPCSTTPEPEVNSTVALAKFKRGNTILALKFLNLMVENREGKNFMFSVLSILILLAQITLNAVGAALEQLLCALNLDNTDQIRVVFPLLLDSFKGQNDVIFELVNKYYAAINYPLSEEFINNGRDIFDSYSENINFSDPDVAAKINAWIASKTNNLINNLVSPDMFDAYTRVAFFNCLYFLGDWRNKFNPKNTKPTDFYLNDVEKILLNTMFQRNTLEYGESDVLDAQIVAVPYKGDQFKLYIYLPRKITGLQDLIKNLTPDLFDEINNCLTPEKVDFSMPTMDISTDISDLIDYLKKCGITAPFESGSNQFTGIFKNNNESLYISKAVQKTVFKANENGTEAAAATGAILSTRSSRPLPSKIYTFNANHPFIFFLKNLDTIIFCGAFLNK